MPSLRARPMIAAGAKCADFQEDVVRGIGDARIVAAHHAGYGQRLFVVGNQQKTAIELGLGAIEQLQRFAVARMAHDDVAFERVVIESMQRLAEFQHHVVGDVDHGADRTQTGATQTLGQPQRRTCSRVDAFDDAAEIARRIAHRLRDEYRDALLP